MLRRSLKLVLTLTASAALLGACAALPAANAVAQTYEPSVSAERISNDIRTISGDDYQGRYPGTDGERMTLAYLQAQYEAMGLQPGGPNGQWLQTVELKRFTPVAGAPTASAIR